MPTVGYRLSAAPRLRRRLDEVVHSSEPGSRTATSPPAAIPALTPPAVFAVVPPPCPPPLPPPWAVELLGLGDTVLVGLGPGGNPPPSESDGDGDGDGLGPVLLGDGDGDTVGQPLPGIGNDLPWIITVHFGAGFFFGGLAFGSGPIMFHS